MNKNTIKKIAVSVISVGAVAAPMIVLAQPDLGIEYGTSLNLGTRDIRETIGSVIQAFMGLLGIIAVLLILYGGFLWMTARGEEAQIGKAKNTIIAGVIGLAIIMTSYAIANFVINALINGTI